MSIIHGVAARRPRVWIPLDKDTKMVLGASRAGTHVRNSVASYVDPYDGLVKSWGSMVEDETGPATYWPANAGMIALDGSAAIRFGTVDISPFAGVAGSSTPYLIDLVDNAGKHCIGYLAEADAIEGYGAAIIDADTLNGDMEDNDIWDNDQAGPTSNAQYDGVADPDGIGGAHGGNKCWKVVTAAGNQGSKTDIAMAVTLGQMYYFYLWVYPASTTSIKIRIRKGDNSVYVYDQIHTGLTQNDWNQIEGYYIEEVGGATAWFSVVAAAGAETFYFDDVEHKPVTALGTDGCHIVSAKNGATLNWASQEGGFDYNDNSGYRFNIYDVIAFNSPRFESVGGHKAILLEPAATNLCTHSHEFDNAAWTKTRSSITANATDAPDGNATADKLVEDGTAASTHFVQDIIAHASFTDDTKVTLTVYVKQAERTWIRLAMRTKVGAGRFGYFDLANGVVGSKSATAITSIKAAANGFYRCRLTHDIESDPAPVDPYFTVHLAEADGDITIDGDGTSGIYVWGAQVEEFPVPTSYVPTSGATASRATESGYPLWTLPAGLFDALGTCSVWVRFGWGETDMLQDGTLEYGGIVNVRDSLTSLAHFWHDSDWATNTILPRSHDGANATINYYDFVIDTWYKLVVKWGYDVGGNEKFRVGIDTGAGISWSTEVNFDGSYTLGANLRLAYNLWGPMWMRDLRLYDRVLSDSEIDSLGSP